MKDVVTIVSGLPRSGTSMMMKMLEAGGLCVVTDNVREADIDNPKGYYELETVKQIKADDSWLDATRGKAFKMVSMLLYELPPDMNYKIIFMKRNLSEILASQRAMLERKEEVGNFDDEEMGKIFRKHLDEIEEWIGSRKNIDVLYLDYHDVLEDPARNSEVISAFLAKELIIEKMAQVVDKTLYRQRSTYKTAVDVPSSVNEMPETAEDQDKEKLIQQLESLGYM